MRKLKSIFNIADLFVLVILFPGVSSCQKDDNSAFDPTDNVTGAYKIVGTNQKKFYGNETEITVPSAGSDFYGQDAQYTGNTPSYHDNGDGTVTDLVTGLMWSKTADLNGDGVINVSDKLTYTQAVARASTFKIGGYTDWRLPTIKELYSLIIFSGIDVNSFNSSAGAVPFIDTNFFTFQYGDVANGERIIDAQYVSSTKYVTTTMRGDQTVFGVNFADGRIKGYGLTMPGGEKTFYVAYVRGNTNYGKNNYLDNNNGTISDLSTGLMWTKDDNTKGVVWKEALSYAENLSDAGYTDWRLPTIKELQSIVDYTRSPSTTSSAAIDPVFNCSAVTNEAGQKDYPFYWSSTTHADCSLLPGTTADYISFGRAMGYMNGSWMDVHGAGCQRSDPKTGNPSAFPQGRGPQGDAIRIYNYVRCVRTI